MSVTTPPRGVPGLDRHPSRPRRSPSRARVQFARPGRDSDRSEDWRAYASCRYHDPNTWFSDDERLRTLARGICAGCAVRTECLDWALTTGQRHGIWGGRLLE